MEYIVFVIYVHTYIRSYVSLYMAGKHIIMKIDSYWEGVAI